MLRYNPQVREGNDPARKLYHKVGFSRTTDGAEPERTLFLEKFLSEERRDKESWVRTLRPYGVARNAVGALRPLTSSARAAPSVRDCGASVRSGSAPLRHRRELQTTQGPRCTRCFAKSILRKWQLRTRDLNNEELSNHETEHVRACFGISGGNRAGPRGPDTRKTHANSVQDDPLAEFLAAFRVTL